MVDAVVADAGVDADAVTINITGAHDVAGNLQVDHTATVGLEIDTLNPTASTLSIVVADNDQTDGDAVSSFTVSTTDVDPGMIHVDMRGSEHTELTSIKSSYIAGVDRAITDLEAAESTAAGLEAAVVTAQGDVDTFFGAGGAGKGYADSAEIGAEASRVEGLGADFDSLEAAVVTAQGDVDTFFGAGGAGEGYADSVAIGTAISGLETLGGQARRLETDVSDARIARDSFFGAGGAGRGYADSAEIGAEASRVEGLGADFDGLEAAVVTAQGDVDTFFGTDGEGDGFADSAAIGDAAAD